MNLGGGTEAGTRREVLAGVQAGRAIAALMVVLYHDSISIFAVPKYGGVKPFGALFDFGSAGVDFFFVLSGFIILHAHRKDLGRAGGVRPYLLKRFWRIYPTYWVVVLAMLAAYWAVPSLGDGAQRRWTVMLSSLLLVHAGTGAAVLTVSWTLFHEVLFYAMFAVLIWRVRVGMVLIGCWLIASVWPLSSGTDAWAGAAATGAAFVVSPLHLLFGLGMLVAFRLARHREIVWPQTLASAGVLLFALMALEVDYGPALPGTSDLMFGVASAAILAGIVQLERSGRLRVPRSLVLTGQASYSIYLIHLPALALAAKIAMPRLAPLHVPAAVSFIGFAAAAVLVGIGWHLLVERPLLKLGRPRRRSDRAAGTERVAGPITAE